MRRPAHAGTFYAGTKDSLEKQIEWCFTHGFGPGKKPRVVSTPVRSVIALISPHAGYVYSGPVAAHAYYDLATDGTPDVVIALGPNHTGLGSSVAMMAEGKWRTPLGDVEIDREMAGRISRLAPIIDIDASAHRYEHSIEVQLAMLQYLYGSSFKFVPISFMMQDLTTVREVGGGVAKAASGTNTVILATTDLTHYEPQEVANKKDRLAIDAISKLDEELLQRVVESQRISMCGLAPVMAAIAASRSLGAQRASLLSYQTSGDITGDLSAVVGYAAIKISR
ncbi:MAG: AmmeMemoRadiSam system protein B [Candidatus Bathyarchaeia archaeon]